MLTRRLWRAAVRCPASLVIGRRRARGRGWRRPPGSPAATLYEIKTCHSAPIPDYPRLSRRIPLNPALRRAPTALSRPAGRPAAGAERQIRARHTGFRNPDSGMLRLAGLTVFRSTPRAPLRVAAKRSSGPTVFRSHGPTVSRSSGQRHALPCVGVPKRGTSRLGAPSRLNGSSDCPARTLRAVPPYRPASDTFARANV